MVSNMRTAFIGDVHGWLGRLDRLLAVLPADVFIIFVGDLIDRGPDSPGVVRRVRALCDAGRAACLLGNHEYAVVRGIGLPELGIEPHQRLFSSWYLRYGGHITARKYGVAGAHHLQLREAMGDDLRWMSTLPYFLAGDAGGCGYIAVHAGLSDEPLNVQLDPLREPNAGWRWRGPLPKQIYATDYVSTVPRDLPEGVQVISGHVFVPRAYSRGNRVLIDTSGGKPGYSLSAYILPERELISVQ